MRGVIKVSCITRYASVYFIFFFGGGGADFFLVGIGLTPFQQNSLKPPKEQYLYSLKSRAQLVKQLPRSLDGQKGGQTDEQSSFYFVLYWS